MAKKKKSLNNECCGSIGESVQTKCSDSNLFQRISEIEIRTMENDPVKLMGNERSVTFNFNDPKIEKKTKEFMDAHCNNVYGIDREIGEIFKIVP
ncbi:MAG: hypothetical protein V4547_18950 [Bacteroidota bacterium]